MPRNRGFQLLAGGLIVVLASLSAYAGEGEKKKCPLPTQECLDKMAQKLENAGWVGIEYEWDDVEKAMQIVKVVPGSPAEGAGLQPGDVLYALNGVSFREQEETKKKAVKEWKPGQTVTYSLRRAGEDRDVTLTLAPMPADVLARYIGQHMLEHASIDLAKK